MESRKPPKKRIRQAISAANPTGRDSLLCEFDACRQTFPGIDPLIDHVIQHLTDHIPRGLAMDDALPRERGVCPWGDCPYVTDGNGHDLARHVYFHCFHVKIKVIGENLVKNSDLPMCRMDTRNRNTIPELPERLLCGWSYCEYLFDNPEWFYRHVANHADVHPRGNNIKDGCPCEWEGCSTVVKSRHKLKDHIRCHTQEKLVACPTCGSLFSSRTKYLDHIRRQQDEPLQSYQCSHCAKQFPTERLLRDHMRFHINHYKCPHCDMTCPVPSALKKHIYYRHSDEKPYACSQCDHLSKSASDLRKHIESHTKAKDYKCDIEGCVYQTNTYYNISRHFRKSHRPSDMGYLCHVCSAYYSNSQTLTEHLKMKHNFKWPPGHTRFRYKLHTDGKFRLQNVRYESVELTQQIMEHTDEPVPAESTNRVSALSEAVFGDSGHPMIDLENDKSDASYNLALLGDVALATGSPQKIVHVLPPGVYSLDDITEECIVGPRGGQEAVESDSSEMLAFEWNATRQPTNQCTITDATNASTTGDQQNWYVIHFTDSD